VYYFTLYIKDVSQQIVDAVKRDVQQIWDNLRLRREVYPGLIMSKLDTDRAIHFNMQYRISLNKYFQDPLSWIIIIKHQRQKKIKNNSHRSIRHPTWTLTRH
jgi:hypothetical protein